MYPDSTLPPDPESAFTQEMTRLYEAENRDYTVIKDISELRGWDIMWLVRWKPGVIGFGARHIDTQAGYGIFKMGFAADSVFAHLQVRDASGIKPEATCCTEAGGNGFDNCIPCGKPATGYSREMLKTATGDRVYLIPTCDEHR